MSGTDGSGMRRTGHRPGGGGVSLLSREHAALVVVDVQEAFRGYASFDGVASSCAKLVKGATDPRAAGTG